MVTLYVDFNLEALFLVTWIILRESQQARGFIESKGSIIRFYAYSLNVASSSKEPIIQTADQVAISHRVKKGSVSCVTFF